MQSDNYYKSVKTEVMLTDNNGIAKGNEKDAIATNVTDSSDDNNLSSKISSESDTTSDSSGDSAYSSSGDNDWGLAGQGNDPDFWVTYP